MRAAIGIGSSWHRLALGRLLAAVVAVAVLVGCTQQAAAVPQNPTRVLPRSSSIPRPPTPEPWPKGWLKPYCNVKDAMKVMSERIRDLSVKIRIQADLRWAANQLISVAQQAEAALRRVPPWKKAQPLIDAYWDVARKTRKAGTAIRRFIQTESMASANAMLKAAREADLAAIKAVIKTGQVNPGLNADCTTV
jgi:hypothetical protein